MQLRWICPSSTNTRRMTGSWWNTVHDGDQSFQDLEILVFGPVPYLPKVTSWCIWNSFNPTTTEVVEFVIRCSSFKLLTIQTSGRLLQTNSGPPPQSSRSWLIKVSLCGKSSKYKLFNSFRESPNQVTSTRLIVWFLAPVKRPQKRISLISITGHDSRDHKKESDSLSPSILILRWWLQTVLTVFQFITIGKRWVRVRQMTNI